MLLTETTFPTPIAAANLFHLCEHEFYFTGSRWMGGWTEASDWDYITQDTIPVRLYLKSLGFKFKDVSDYASPSFSLWELVAPEGVVQVQLTYDAKRLHRAACLIREHHFKEHLAMPKAKRGALWSEAWNQS